MAEDIRKVERTGKQGFEKYYTKPYCILLDSEYASMGRMIGITACKKSGYNYFDAATLLELVPEEGFTFEELQQFEKGLRMERTKEELLQSDACRRVLTIFQRAVKIALEKGPCLIHDQGTRHVIEEYGYTCLDVLCYSDNTENKIKRAKGSVLFQDIEAEAEVLAKIAEEDQIRKNYHRANCDTEWGEKTTYDLCLNTDTFGIEYAGLLIASLVKDVNQ